MMVVAPGSQECCSGQAEVRAIGGNGEAQYVAVEGRRACEIGNAQVHVADMDIGVKL
jgi:hypothetical protein